MAKKCLLFAYGLLQPGYSPPRSMSNHWPDRLRATLYDFGAYPGATEIGKAATLIEGHTLEIDTSELPDLDDFEDVESGEFTRKIAQTEGGHTVWVYEYTGEIPKVLAPTLKWQR